MIKQLNTLFFTFLFTFIFCQTSFAENQLTHIQIVGKNHLILQFSHPTTYRSFTLSSPERFVMDFTETTLAPSAISLSSASLRDLPLRNIRSSVSPQKTLRLVFDLTSNQRTQIQSFANGAGNAWRLGVTFIPQASTNTKKPVQQQTASKKTTTPSAKATYQRQRVTIIIDAGHGGKDPGAHGSYGTREKEVTLGIARQLATLINRQPGMRAVLTRNGNYYIDLRQRLILARKNSGDLFISIHADAFSNHYAHGASVYALSEKGGTSEAARWLAAKENYSELGGVNLNTLDDQNGMVRSVLIDLSETATIGASLELGSNVLSSMGKVTPLHHRYVEQAQFVVLKSLDIPSILIETGFISNPQEEKNLRNPVYQRKLAQAILQGIQHYLAEHPPVGSSYWVNK